jgi:hypothetical protein
MARILCTAIICGTIVYLAHMARDWNVPKIQVNHHVIWEDLFAR